ncbi:MAG: WYL domain-containing protein [Phascolarctobacterium sp.]
MAKDVNIVAYSELVKNLDNIRMVMRDFYVYGFKSKADFSDRSARSHDNDRRRIESWLADYMCFRQNAKGKRRFIAVDSRKIKHNPFYKAWKAKTFTSKDIMLHFYLLDMLQDGISMSLNELVECLDQDYLSNFADAGTIDASTVRKKLTEYVQLGLIVAAKQGRELLYSRSKDTVNLERWHEAVSFFAESTPVGVVGSFLEDKYSEEVNLFSYKHHYLLQALESDVLVDLLDAMQKKQTVRLASCTDGGKRICMRVLPLKIYVSTQSGRRYVMGWFFKANRIIFCRLDNLEQVLEPKDLPDYDKFLAKAEAMEQHLWGVSMNRIGEDGEIKLEHVELVVRLGEDEPYILQCLEREKRCGEVTKLSEGRYQFTADVRDAGELLPWLRTFIGRIESFSCSNKKIEERFWRDMEAVYAMYGLSEAGGKHE